MSLLLDARKKSLQANGHAASADELRLEGDAPQAGKSPAAANQTAQTDEAARNAGQKLFNAKFSPSERMLPNPKLLLTLGATALLLAIGVGYLWYLDSATPPVMLRPVSAPPPQPLVPVQPAAPTESAPQQKPATAIAENPATPLQTSPMSEPPLQGYSPIRIEQQKDIEQLDPLLLNAYSAYQTGRLDEAQQLYLAMLQKDARNPDTLLGLAAIAQQRGEPQEAAQYFGRVLALDPRNAAANAGMAALRSDDENTESRLKTLLREQSDSAALHFALGNLYAGQSRWGEAQQAYFNAYTLEPGNAEYVFNLAVSLDHLGQGKLAAQHYQRALQLDPSHRAGFDHAQISQRIQELMR